MLQRFDAFLLEQDTPCRSRTALLDTAMRFLRWLEDCDIPTVPSGIADDYDTRWEVRERFLIADCADRDCRHDLRTQINRFLRFLSLQAATLSTDQFTALTTAKLGAMGADQISALNTDNAPARVVGTSTNQGATLTSPAELAAIAGAQIGLLGTDQIAAIDTAQLNAFTTGQMAVTTTAQVTSMGADQITGPEPNRA